MPLPPKPKYKAALLNPVTKKTIVPKSSIKRPAKLSSTSSDQLIDPDTSNINNIDDAKKQALAFDEKMSSIEPVLSQVINNSVSIVEPSVRKNAKRGAQSSTVSSTVKSSHTQSPTNTPTQTKTRASGMKKWFVLDTNVLLHDPMSLFRFAEHDILLPMVTLEELDNHKQGLTEVARNARTVSRSLDALINKHQKLTGETGLQGGIPLNQLGHVEATGSLYFESTDPLKSQLALTTTADNQILEMVSRLQQQNPDRAVVLVSKDINIRIKAHALGLPVEDYHNDKVLDDTDLLYNGITELPANFWQKVGKSLESWTDPKTGHIFYRFRPNKFTPPLLYNQMVCATDPSDATLPPLMAMVTNLADGWVTLRLLMPFNSAHQSVWGIQARNREQLFALNLLMDRNIDLVTIIGQAGTGKTLLALAAGLECVLEKKWYSEIIITRATVSVGDDIGFLPGTEEEKMQPWMGAIDDNLEVLQKNSAGGEWGRLATQDLIRTRVRVKSMSFMRGRTFTEKLVIIDEAQNLTPKQIKTLITRAGQGTKVICLGNLSQIDTPYLTEGASGLTYLVDRFKGWSNSGHVTLTRGERSRLADHASDIL